MAKYFEWRAVVVGGSERANTNVLTLVVWRLGMDCWCGSNWCTVLSMVRSGSAFPGIETVLEVKLAGIFTCVDICN